MSTLRSSKVIVIGGSSGVGRATVLALLERGAEVVAVGRNPARLEALRAEAPRPLAIRALDATDRAAVDRLFAETAPDHVVVAAGTHAPMALLDEQTWEGFSRPWNEDVKMAFEVGQAAFRQVQPEGCHVLFVSSGAGLLGSPLSGGYAGSKRTQMFMTGYFQRAAKERKKKLRFTAIVPKQLIADTQTGHEVSLTYARLAGITQAKFMERFEVPLLARGVADAIVRALEGEFAEGALVAVTGKGTELL
ncbi:MAG TPA: SDR family oxidoreductase [Polyangiaceae bacterium]|jgi:NAD(P)-dependent dehydrogenase (short-subunit alcohol dehydrogenase family)|nr:SDR family oxidoreductase [Polyangiaceae bacterium]